MELQHHQVRCIRFNHGIGLTIGVAKFHFPDCRCQLFNNSAYLPAYYALVRKVFQDRNYCQNFDHRAFSDLRTKQEVR